MMNMLRNSMFVTLCCAKQTQVHPLQLRTSKLAQTAAQCTKPIANYSAGRKTYSRCSSVHNIHSKLQLMAQIPTASCSSGLVTHSILQLRA